MAIKYLNDGFVTLLKKDTAGAILYQVGTHEGQTILKATTGNFGAVNAGTTAAQVTGADSDVLYRLTINAADTANLGPVIFESKGATDTTYVWGMVVAELPGMVAASGIPVGGFVNDAITANAIATDAIGAAELATGAVTEIVTAILVADLAGYEATGPTGTRLADMIVANRAELAGAMTLSGTTLTVHKVGGGAMGSHTLDSATMPRTRTGLA